MTAADIDLDHVDVVALLARQTEVLGEIATGVHLGGVLSRIATTLEELVPDCRCSILLLDRVTATLRHGASPSLPKDYSAGIDGMVIGPNAGSCGSAAYTDNPVIVSDIRSDPRWKPFRTLAARAGLRACWSTPIHGRDGTVCGTFAVYHAAPHRPTPREAQLVTRLTHLASVAIDHDNLLSALAESEERFRRAFEDNAVGMALADLNGEITRVNRSMRALLACRDSDLIGTRLDERFAAGQECGVRDNHQYETSVRTVDGRELDVAVAISAIRDALDTPRALSINVLDITGRHAAERERHRRVEAELAQQAAESANRAKTDFVSALGHELRTPLQAITGFTELLTTLDLDPERRTAALDHIAAAAGHILTIVDDVLDVSRIEAHALPLTLTDIEVAPLIDGVLAMLEPLATAERVRMSIVVGPEPLGVRADERRLRQVLLNLVSNAVRYNHAGGSVVVAWHADGERARLVVRDSGSGIAPEHFNRLFAPFDRLGRDSGEGVGLGLPLARGLTEAMGGSLAVDSEVHQGTTVTVVLPLADPRGQS